MTVSPNIRLHAHIDLTKLEGVRDRSADLTPVWLADVQPWVTALLHRRFDTVGAYLGAKWAPLAPRTIAARLRPGRGRGDIGRDTNRMWASLVKSAGSTAAPGGLLRIAPQQYERGTAVSYARYFAGGTRRQPPRPIFPSPLPAELISRVEGAVRRYLATGKTGGR